MADTPEAAREVQEMVAAALDYARRAALEDAARVAEAAYESRNHADRSPRHIARAIRALAGSTKEGE